MYFLLTEALATKFVEELRQFWSYHPKHLDLVDNIQGKYSFKSRPQKSIVVRPQGGTHISLSPDNFKGTVLSYVYLAKVKGKPGVALEWVREDSVAIQENAGAFPSAPGVYYLDLVEDNQFFVDPLYDVFHEQVMLTDPTRAVLAKAPVSGSVRLYEMPAGFLYQEGTNYMIVKDDEGKNTAELVLTSPLTGGRYLEADYRWEGESTGPHTIYERQANNKVVPGVVLAFGRRCQKGDQLAVVVQDIRRPAALEYGGRWEIPVEFEVSARDVHDTREIADESVMYLFGVARSILSTQGIEITSISMGGESEEVYDETGDDYSYTATFSLQCETEWSLFDPLDRYLRQVAPMTATQLRSLAGMTDDQVANLTGDIKGLTSLGLVSFEDPFWSGREGTMEVIR